MGNYGDVPLGNYGDVPLGNYSGVLASDWGITLAPTFAALGEAQKWRNLERRPHASLCVDTREPPYAAVVIDDDVQPSDRPLYELVRAMAVAYYGEEQGLAFAEGYRGDKPDTVLFRIVPRHITSWDYRD